MIFRIYETISRWSNWARVANNLQHPFVFRTWKRRATSRREVERQGGPKPQTIRFHSLFSLSYAAFLVHPVVSPKTTLNIIHTMKLIHDEVDDRIISGAAAKGSKRSNHRSSTDKNSGLLRQIRSLSSRCHKADCYFGYIPIFTRVPLCCD